MRIIIFASGNGSNAENIINFAKNSGIQVEALLCDKQYAPVIKKAEELGVKTFFIPYEISDTKKDHEKKIFKVLDSLQFDWICLAGYMRILSSDFIKKYSYKKSGLSKVINIHPSLLPSFKGKDAYKQAFDYGVKISGVTVHLVDENIDTGPILLQKTFNRNENDSFLDFKNKGMQVEYKIYPEVLTQLRNFDPILEKGSQTISWRSRCD